MSKLIIFQMSQTITINFIYCTITFVTITIKLNSERQIIESTRYWLGPY